jgi:hypothetical protein
MSDPTVRPASDEEWKDLLHQLRLQKTQPRPFFYTRVQARLVAARPASSWLAGWLRRPAYVALLGALVLAVSGDGGALHSASAASQYSGYHSIQPAPTVAR